MYICTPPRKYIKPPKQNKSIASPFLLLKIHICIIFIFFVLGARDTRHILLPTPTYSYRVWGGIWGCLAWFIPCRGFLHRTPDSSSSTQGPAVLTSPHHPRPSRAQWGIPVQEPWRKQRIPERYRWGPCSNAGPTLCLATMRGGEWNEATPTYLPPAAINASGGSCGTLSSHPSLGMRRKD